jgi:hypothetical protein
MQTKAIGRGICTAAALAAVAAVPATADAAKKPYKEATFKATLSGSQVTTWEYHHAKQKDNPCDASANGYGDQTIKFVPGRTFRVTFRTPPKGQPDLYLTDGRPTVFTTPFVLNVAATAERNADLTVNYSEVDPNQCGDNGGADPNYVPTPKDCGMRSGRFGVRLYFNDPSEDDDLVVPLPGSRDEPDKDHLKLSSTQAEWDKPGSDDTATELRDTYVNCPWFLSSYPEDAGIPWISSAKIKESRLFDKKRRKLVISGDHTVDLKATDTTGKTILAWNLRLTRVK